MGYSNRVLPGEFRGGIPFTVSLDGRLLLERASTFSRGKRTSTKIIQNLQNGNLHH